MSAVVNSLQDYRIFDFYSKKGKIARSRLAKTFNNLQVIGNGSCGLVFAASNSHVIKFTKEKSEVNVGRYLMNHPCPSITNIYSVRNIMPKVWQIVAERVIPAREYFSFEDSEEVYNGMVEYENRKHHPELAKAGPLKEMIQKGHDLMAGLAEFGFWWGDSHLGNVGVRPSTGELVVLDLGFLQKRD